MTHLYCVTGRDETRHRQYLFLHPDSGEVVSGDVFENAYYHQPAAFEEMRAKELVEQFVVEKPGVSWALEIAPNPCACCGRALWANDHDFCYPQNREMTRYRAGCNVHDFGCGLEVQADSFEDAMRRWNDIELYDYKGRGYSRVEGKGAKALEAELRAAYGDYPEYQADTDTEKAFEAMVQRFADDAFYNLHFVAKHFLHLKHNDSPGETWDEDAPRKHAMAAERPRKQRGPGAVNGD